MSLRTDLQLSPIQMGHEDYIVVKDPLSRSYFYFTQREWLILELLDGNRSITEVASDLARRFSKDYISANALSQFIGQAKTQGLLRGPESLHVPQRRSSTTPLSWIKNPLAIRLPGLNPDAFLDQWISPVRVFSGPTIILSWCAAVVLATVLVVTNFQEFSRDIAQAASRTSVSWWLIVAIVISITKIIHELAHALTCKLFGSECRELGIMFLVGIPCLYCDVSDAWMIPQRWKRVLVSAAGMLAELAIAAFAVFAWRLLDPSIAKDICVSVVVVCSVSTLLFNGNPLLKYDGYFILSDLVGIPNLSMESRTAVRESTRQLFSNLAKPTTAGSPPLSRRVFVYTYGWISGVYRLFVVFLLSSVAYHWLSDRGMQRFAATLACLVAVGIAYRTLKPVFARPTSSQRGPRHAKPRRALLFAAISTLVACILFTPFPRHVTAPLLVLPENGAPVLNPTAGQVVQAIPYQTRVSEGDIIATLHNADESLQLEIQSTRRDELETRLVSLRSEQVSNQAAATQIPATEDLLKSVNDRCKLLSDNLDNLDNLVVRASRSGVFFAPPSRPEGADLGAIALSWDGTPLHSRNRGVHLPKGTLIGTIGDASNREALVLVEQKNISLIGVGQEIEVLSPSHRRGALGGIVVEISQSPLDSVPDELLASGLIPLTELARPRDAYYQLRVSLHQSTSPLPIRSTSRSRIRIKSASLFQRIAKDLGIAAWH